jgi:HAD superfamily hydrolase (TIGR01509 family)
MTPATPGGTFAAVIFDLDGLLLDTERVSIDAGVAAVADLGHVVTPGFMMTLVGIDNRAGIVRLNAHLGTDMDADLLDLAWQRHSDRIMSAGVALRPGADILLARLSAAGMPHAVATNSRTRRAEEKLANSALAGRIATVVGYDLVPAGKPAPDVYLEAARRLGVDPAACLAFEDSDPGVAAALAAGMTVVQVPDLLPATGGRAHHLAATLLDGAAWAGLPGGTG